MPALAMASMLSLMYVDVEGDGDDDVLGVTSSSNVLLLLNDGRGNFTNATASRGVMVASNRAVAVTVGDVDGDGDVDLFVCTAFPSSIIMMENNGSGGFVDVTVARLDPNLSTTEALVASTLMDVDGDGDLDLFVPITSGNRFYINVGNGTLVDSGVSRGVASYSGGGVVRGASAADVDSDGDVDVMVFGSGSLQLYLNNGSGWFVDGAASGLMLALDAMSASFGDVDNDGDVDAVFGSSASPSLAAINDGRGRLNATAAVMGVVSSAAPVLVDVDGDGDVDIPAAGFVNNVVPPGVIGSGVASVRVLSRSGRRVCNGVTIVMRRSGDGAVAMSRIVPSGTAPYDVHIASPHDGTFDIDVSFPSGRRHSKSTQAALSGLRLSTVSSPSVPTIVVRDTPAIVSVRLLSPSGVYGPGSTLTAIVRALGDEPGLSASSSCTINGVNVSSSMVDCGNGTYTFAYVVQASHRSVAGVPATLQLFDSRWGGVSSDAVSTVLGADAVFVDTMPPRVSFNSTANCSPDNGTVTATMNQTLCLSCGSLSAEPFGCAIWLRVNASLPPQRIRASRENNSVMVDTGPFFSGQLPVIVAWAEDEAGNVGSSAVLTWEVDLESPVTLWTPESPPAHTNQTTMLFSFGCTLANCSFDYAFGSGSRLRLGANSTSDGAAAQLATVDTVLGALPPRLSTVASATVNVSATVNGAALLVNSSSGNVTVEVRLDGGVWTDVREFGGAFNSATQQLLLAGLQDGMHSLQARGRVSDAESDEAPWTHVWSVDRRAPNVAFWLAPPQLSLTPQCVAAFVLVADEDGALFEVQWRAMNVTGGDDGRVSESAWTVLPTAELSLNGLTAAMPYVLHARATDRVGNVGTASSWRWSSGSCPPVSSIAVALLVERFAVANHTQAIMWSVTSAMSLLPSEVQYRVNAGVWVRTTDRPILLRGLNATTHYRVDVRPAVPCGCEAVIPEQSWSSTHWFTYESGPGRVGIVSAPTLSSNSLFGDFYLNSTPPAGDAWFEYSLDGGSFAGCDSKLRVGPLALGRHNVTVRSVDSSGAFIAGAEQTFSWTVVSLSSSSLALTDLPDGEQSLKVWALKPPSVERSPRTVRWVVDTVPPVVLATLVTPTVSNASSGAVTMSCATESYNIRISVCTVCP
jgi:hypothetical protein